METISLKEFCANNGVISLGNVKLSEKNHPFVTLRTNGDAINLWFSKNASKVVKVGQDAKEAGLAKAFVVSVENEEGELRHKISFNKQTSVDDMDW